MRTTGRVFCSDFGRRLFPLLRLLAGVSLGLLDVAMMHIARGVVTKRYEIYNLIHSGPHSTPFWPRKRRISVRTGSLAPCSPVAGRGVLCGVEGLAERSNIYNMYDSVYGSNHIYNFCWTARVFRNESNTIEN